MKSKNNKRKVLKKNKTIKKAKKGSTVDYAINCRFSVKYTAQFLTA